MRIKEWKFALITVGAALVVTGVAGVAEKVGGAEAKPKITVDAGPGVKVVEVNPRMAFAKGKKKGTLVVVVTLRNTGTAPQRFMVFAGGVVEGGQLSGRNTIPKKGKLGPNEVGKAKIKTKYTGTALPGEVVVEVGPCLFGPGCE